VKLRKIKYTMNFLCAMSEEDGQLIDAIANSNEMSIFETELVMDLIDFRWLAFAKRTQKVGFFFHVLYIITMALYIKAAYLGQDFGYGE
jgi:hypothetical protein